jgi:AmmeMemoRadiSam system protein B
MNETRPPAVAGLFYPASASKLAANVDSLLKAAGEPSDKNEVPVALIVPHAGYVYSGLTAAHAFAHLFGHSFDSVIVVGPSHREYFHGISVYPGDAYRTPLGDVAVDVELRDALAEKGLLISMQGHRTEHSVEVQFPFLQRTLGTFKAVPVVMGDQRPELCKQLGDAIASAVRAKNVLLVASSDLSHYHPYDEAVVLDRKVVASIDAYDTEELIRNLEMERVEACGGGPIAAVMLAARKLGARTARVLHYCNSGDVTGDKGAVVGYLSALITSRALAESVRVH